jgi:hypothetical protein
MKQVQTVSHTLKQIGGDSVSDKPKKKELTFRNWVKIGNEYVPLKDLPKEVQQDFGNFVRRRPMEALGYIVEEAT